MPYYIYRVTPLGPVRQLARLSQFEVFKEASTEAKRLRREAGLAPGELIKTIFAENELQAEELLSQPAREDFADGKNY